MKILSDFFNHPIIMRVRRHHGLEHASIHVISNRHPDVALAGYSDIKGFWLLGNVPIGEVFSGVSDALDRVKNGERTLTIHPNCGTNRVTAGVLIGLVTLISMSGVGSTTKERLNRMPMLIGLIAVTLMISESVGQRIQSSATVSDDLDRIRGVRITHYIFGKLNIYRIVPNP